MTRREILKGLGLVGVAGVTGAAFGDEVVADGGKLPAGSVGDPNNVWFGRHIFPLEPTMTDGPSAYVKDGKIIQPQVELPLFHTADVVVVGGGPAGFAAAGASAKTSCGDAVPMARTSAIHPGMAAERKAGHQRLIPSAPRW